VRGRRRRHDLEFDVDFTHHHDPDDQHEYDHDVVGHARREAEGAEAEGAEAEGAEGARTKAARREAEGVEAAHADEARFASAAPLEAASLEAAAPQVWCLVEAGRARRWWRRREPRRRRWRRPRQQWGSRQRQVGKPLPSGEPGRETPPPRLHSPRLTLPHGEGSKCRRGTLLPIGKFAAASRLSLKALRLYDDNGLLPPARVDPDSGYRYYRPDQLGAATVIRLLRGCDMPLAEIRAFLAAPSTVTLDEYERTLADELADRRRILRYLRERLKEEPMFEVQTKRVEELPYVSRTKRVRVPHLEPFIVGTINELTTEHEASDHAFSLYHGAVNEQDDGPVEVCLPTPGGDKQLPAGEVAYTVATGEQCAFPEILGAYDAVARWAAENGRELDGPPREIYRSEQELEIAWPVR
jgi:DNA-binding transcriptional MerR regulator